MVKVNHIEAITMGHQVDPTAEIKQPLRPILIPIFFHASHLERLKLIRALNGRKVFQRCHKRVIG